MYASAIVPFGTDYCTFWYRMYILWTHLNCGKLKFYTVLYFRYCTFKYSNCNFELMRVAISDIMR